MTGEKRVYTRWSGLRLVAIKLPICGTTETYWAISTYKDHHYDLQRPYQPDLILGTDKSHH